MKLLVLQMNIVRAVSEALTKNNSAELLFTVNSKIIKAEVTVELFEVPKGTEFKLVYKDKSKEFRYYSFFIDRLISNLFRFILETYGEETLIECEDKAKSFHLKLSDINNYKYKSNAVYGDDTDSAFDLVLGMIDKEVK